MFHRNGLRSTFPSPNAIGVRAYGAAIDEHFRERRANMRHLQQLQRRVMEQEAERRAGGPVKNSYSQPGNYVGQEDFVGKERELKPTMSQIGRLEVSSPHVVNRLFLAEEPNYSHVEMEDEDMNTVCPRRELVFEEDSDEELQTGPTSLFDCVSSGVLDMDAAARMIYEQKQGGVFKKEEYEDFVKSEVAISATPRFSDSDDMDDPQTVKLYVLANRLMGEINHAHLLKISRRSNFTENAAVPINMPQLSLANCSKTWRLQASPPFVELDIMDVAIRWQRRRNDNTFQQLTSLFRFLLLHVTDPPHRIREFTVRVSKNGGRRDENLKDLPEEVEATLIGFGEDLMGYGREEPRPSAVLSWDGSGFCTNLAPSERTHSDYMVARERNEWRLHLLKSLQSALCDVRSYGYDVVEGKWLPSSRWRRTVSQLGGGSFANETTNTENLPSSKPYGF